MQLLCNVSDAISENNPRVIDDARARKLATDLKRCSYYETCATYGLNVERVFQDGKESIWVYIEKYILIISNHISFHLKSHILCEITWSVRSWPDDCDCGSCPIKLK